MSGISVNKEGLQAALSNFESISGSISGNFTTIKTNLESIERNWLGPEHDSAASDKANAEENMQKALDTLANMEGAIAKLSANANKISYNG